MKYPKGLTLIEVLVASVLMFMAIGLSSLVFKHSVDSSQRIGELYILSAYAKSIRNNISESLRNSPNQKEGAGVIGGMPYNWKIVLTEEKNSRPWLNSESSLVNTGYYSLYLHTIEVSIYRKNTVVTADSHPFREVSLKILDWKRV